MLAAALSLATVQPLVTAPSRVPTASPSAAPACRWALDGGNDENPARTCLDRHNATVVNGVVVAAQCCDASDSTQNGCRRWVGGTKDDDDCVAGMPPRPYNFLQTEQLCADLGLMTCEQPCAGR
jgi:hypothetical protein